MTRRDATIQAGYREGITEGKRATLQKGFDQGFALSVPGSRRLGRLRGRANALLQCASAGRVGDSVLVDEVRGVVGELGSVRKGSVVPRDRDREAHERSEHIEGEFGLKKSAGREMEGLVNGMEGLGGRARSEAGKGEGEREGEGGEVLDRLERRLRDLEQRIRIRVRGR